MLKRPIILVLVLVLFSSVIKAQEPPFDYERFVDDYFSAWLDVQKPDATAKDLEHYLSFLADDVGYQHLPYSADDSRQPDGKENMRKGMAHYLGSHKEHSATLTHQSVGYNVVVIKYNTQSKGVHPDNGEIITLDYNALEVLELENGKVSVLRHYSE